MTGVDIEHNAIGMLLAYGAGNVIYVATVELYPREHSHEFGEISQKKPGKRESQSDKLYKMVTGLLTFMVGVVAVSIILLNHEHCEESTDDSNAEAHAHRHFKSFFE